MVDIALWYDTRGAGGSMAGATGCSSLRRSKARTERWPICPTSTDPRWADVLLGRASLRAQPYSGRVRLEHACRALSGLDQVIA